MSEDFRPCIRALIYPVQFERDPLDGVDRVVRAALAEGVLGAPPERCLALLRSALASDERLAQLIPQDHPEEAIRRFLAEVERRLSRDAE